MSHQQWRQFWKIKTAEPFGSIAQIISHKITPNLPYFNHYYTKYKKLSFLKFWISIFIIWKESGITLTSNSWAEHPSLMRGSRYFRAERGTGHLTYFGCITFVCQPSYRNKILFHALDVFSFPFFSYAGTASFNRVYNFSHPQKYFLS